MTFLESERLMNSVLCPKVSIVIPVYNGANYLREAVDSALAQTYKNIEIIVVNDGSTDQGETESIALSYGDRIRYFRKENGGVSSALNYGISQMTGDYFSWLSHDDVYGPDKIQHQIEGITLAGDKDAVALCAHYFIDGNSDRLSKKAPKRFQNGHHLWNHVIREILTNGAFSGCALLLPKKVFEDCGFFNEQLRFSQDYLMWMSVFLKGYSLVYNDHEDVCSRIHKKQLTQRGRNIFMKDSVSISRLLIPEIARISSRADNYLFLFAKRNAMHGVKQVVGECVNAAKEKKLFGFGQRLSLYSGLLFGKVRPGLRKLYYSLVVRPQ